MKVRTQNYQQNVALFDRSFSCLSVSWHQNLILVQRDRNFFEHDAQENLWQTELVLLWLGVNPQLRVCVDGFNHCKTKGVLSILWTSHLQW